MESRKQILDRLAKKWGQKTNPLVENFDDFQIFFNSDAVFQLVYMAMAEYSKQSRINSNEKDREYYTEPKIADIMIDTMKEKWAHCFIGDKLVQRPDNFENEISNKIEGAEIMLKKLCWIKSDRTDDEDIFSLLNKKDDK